MDDPESFPLHDAAREGKILLIKKLLDEDKSLSVKKDNDGRTALFWAISGNNAEAASEILKAARTLRKFDVDQVDDAGWTVLHVAASIGNLEIIEQLLWPLEPLVDATTNAGQTPLHFAVAKNHHRVIQFLIENKASVRARDKLGQTPLHRAAAVGSLPVVKTLIEAKAPINASDNSQWTPLHHAAAEGHGEIVVYLVTQGGDIERKDADGLTPMDVAVDDKVRKYITTHLTS